MPLPLERLHLVASGRLWSRLEDFRRSDRALFALQGCFPSFDDESTLLKVLALHSVDTSKTFVGMPLARRVQELFTHVDPSGAGPELVDALAATAEPFGKRSMGGLVFASRFAHFFVSSDRFPILDAWSERTLAWLLELPLEAAPGESRYSAFARAFAHVAAGLQLTRRRELGRWLWLAGQYRAWNQSPRTPMHASVRALFESQPIELCLLLSELEPPAALPAARPPERAGPPSPSAGPRAVSEPPSAG